MEELPIGLLDMTDPETVDILAEVTEDQRIEDGNSGQTESEVEQHAKDVLKEYGFDAKDIASMLSDYNGDLTFRTDEAQVGYIKPEEYLVLPVNVSQGDKSEDYSAYIEKDVLDTPAAQKISLAKMMMITSLNIPCLGGGEEAIPYAYMRAKLVEKGYLYEFVEEAKSGRCVYTDEVRACTYTEFKKVMDSDKAAIKSFFKSPVRSFIDKHWRIICAMLGHVLVVRGHHFRDAKMGNNPDENIESYTELYKRLWRASAIEGDFPFRDIKKLFRTTLHPFGLKVFTDILEDGVDKGILPRTFEIRIDAIPAGCAKIGTGAAVLKMMRAATWYNHFQNRFKDEIKIIFDAEKEIKKNRLRYHVSPKLFGKSAPFSGDREKIAHAIDVVSAIAPYIVAYIQVECEDSPITSQRTLNGPANDQMGLMNSFKRFLENLSKRADETTEINDIIPKVQGPAPVPVPDAT